MPETLRNLRLFRINVNTITSSLAFLMSILRLMLCVKITLKDYSCKTKDDKECEEVGSTRQICALFLGEFNSLLVQKSFQ